MNNRRPLLLAADAAGDPRRSRYGYDTANIGSALNFVPYGPHALAQGYLVRGASPGGAAEAILAGPVADRFGRKKLLIADAGIYATGAIIPAVTPDAAVRLFARTLIGLAIGADSAIATASIAEYAPKTGAGRWPCSAVDDHRRHPDLLPRRAGHLQRLPGQRSQHRLADGALPRRDSRADRPGAAYPDAAMTDPVTFVASALVTCLRASRALATARPDGDQRWGVDAGQ